MKLTRKKSDTKKVKAVKPKKSFNYAEFKRSVETLDTQNYGSWPVAIKVICLAVMIAVMSALAWAFLISNKIDEIKAAESEQETLLQTYKEKESKARHLEEYKAQVAQMEVEFTELLNQLPKDTRVSDLVDGINAIGKGSNIRFKDISVEPEVTQEFFIEQPIRIEALGDYNEFGSFISGLASLPRIITMHDFDVSNSKPSLDSMPDLNLVLHTKTYRSKDVTSDDQAQTTEGGN